MKHLFSILFIMLCLSQFVQGQSYHFSQFFTTPLLTNPANTGTTDGPYRLASNFRAQGISGGSPYFTGYISADISPFKEKLNAGHKVGVGLYIMNDQALNGALKTNTIGFSGAYNVGLDANKIHSLGLGFQGTYQQRRIDYSQLSFDEQFGGTSYNPSLPTGENFDAYKRNYFDLNTGLLYRMQAEKMSFFAGISGYNVIRHKDNLMSEEFKMPTRYVLQSGAQFLSGTTGTIYLSLTYMQQAKASATSLGAAYGIQLSETENHEIRFGAWYRLQDAVIPYIGYVKNGFQVGLTYDYTTSSKKTGAEVRNGYELTLMYTAPDKNALKRALPWY